MRSLMIIVVSLMLVSGVGIASAQTFDFKGIVLGSKSTVNVLQQQHGLKDCRPEIHNRANVGVRCHGKTTLLGKDGTLRVILNNEGVVVSIYVAYKTDPIKRRVIFDDMTKALSQKFGAPRRPFAGAVHWSNARGHVVEFTSSHLDMRGGRSAPDPKLSEKDRRDL